MAFRSLSAFVHFAIDNFWQKRYKLIFSRLAIDFEKTSLFSFIFPNFVLLTMALLAGWLCGKFIENLPFRALGCWVTS
ncbi:MAG: hypothetical protein WKF71_12435 [Pyrinomonadaceae bacterium]